MSLTAQVVRRNLGMGWVLAVMTLVSIVISVVIVVGVLLLAFGTDAARNVTVWEFWGFAISFAAGVPAVACPVVGTRMLMLLRDLNHAKEELARIADTDQLTSLLNRRGLEKAAARVLASAEAAGTPVAMLMCDIDHFKSINDTFGHDFGDQALKTVATVIRETLEKHEVVACRFGGEEFVLLLPDASTAKARLLAEELRLALSLRPVEWQGNSSRITMSVGIAAARQPQSDLSRLLSYADGALYRAKNAGRNRVEADQLDVVVSVAQEKCA
jgi:diguanylate cyclase (GGDEF)-like protein